MSRGLRMAALAALLYAAGVAAWIGYDRRSAREVFEAGSVFNSGEDGLSLAYAYLRERSGSAATLHRRINAAELPPRGVVVRVQATRAPLLLDDEDDEERGDEEKDFKNPRKEEEERDEALRPPPLLTPEEEAWVRGGGRMVVAFGRSYGPATSENLTGRQPVRKVYPIWPGVFHLVPPVARWLSVPPLPASHAVFLAGLSPMIVRQPLGKGDLVLLAAPEMLHNVHLGRGHHLALLEALVGVRERRPVLFDERVHGLADSGGVLETLAGWGLGPLLLLGLLAIGAGFWRSAARLGPPERDERDTRSDAVELLDSLADLYDRALGRSDAVRLYHESFLHTLAVETGLRGGSLEERAGRLLDGFTPPEPGEDLSRERFDRALQTINQAFRRLQDAKRK